MNDTDVIIVGGGPSGLALAVALSRMKIHSVVLEKEHDICEDPRAIALAGDAHRILSLLGISEDYFYENIGQALHVLHFHNGPFTSAPFFDLSTKEDWSQQVVAGASVFLQPQLEQVLRNMAEASPYITLKLDCNVVEVHQTSQHASAAYEQKIASPKSVIQGKYLVGADGKRGFVRKGYLEKRGVRQVTGSYPYEATWVAANLRITMPTPATHPDFPLWELGYKPEDLWDIFWPEDWHFCAHPTLPVATGRFGPKSEKLWRFEYEVPAGYQLPDDIAGHLKGVMEPHMSMTPVQLSRLGRNPLFPVQFPWDCVEVIRCNPAFFAQRVVNKWFDGRVILIGDAAHVFPPFGAQGIASGLRDALGLSWRLSVLCRPENEQKILPDMSDAMLDAWSRERRQGVDEASRMTSANGNLMQTKSAVASTAIRIASSFLGLVPRFQNILLRSHMSDANGISNVEGGFFLRNAGGGRKFAQVYINHPSQSRNLSDSLFWNPGSALTVLVLHPQAEDGIALRQLISRRKGQSPRLVSSRVIILQDEQGVVESWSQNSTDVGILMPAATDELSQKGVKPPEFYQAGNFRSRFPSKTRYALLRPDFIIFSQAETLAELEAQIEKAGNMATREE